MGFGSTVFLFFKKIFLVLTRTSLVGSTEFIKNIAELTEFYHINIVFDSNN